MWCRMRYNLFFAFVAGITLLLVATQTYAETRYIVDVLVVSLREGPATSYRSIKSIKTGNSFKVIDKENKFIKVELNDGTIGWLPEQYTSAIPPKSIIADKLSQKLERVTKKHDALESKTKKLKEQIASQAKEISELEHKYSLVKKTENTDLIKLQKQLDAVTQDYETLSEQSQSTIEISQERDLLKKNTASLAAKVRNLESQNTSLANKQALYWFLAGSGVIFLGWLLGRFSCKRQKSSLTL